jgi:multisubunit Na+/H+ antiporter MnhC subunit
VTCACRCVSSCDDHSCTRYSAHASFTITVQLYLYTAIVIGLLTKAYALTITVQLHLYTAIVIGLLTKAYALTITVQLYTHTLQI